MRLHLSARDAAATILRTYPKCGFDEAELANEVMISAASAGVAVQIGKATSEVMDCRRLAKPGPIQNSSDRVEVL